VAISPGGQTAATMDCTGTLFLWEVRTEKPPRKFQWKWESDGLPSPPGLHNSSIIGFSQDGTKVMARDASQTVHLIEVNTGRELGSLELGAGTEVAEASPDGKLLATTEDNTEANGSNITLRNLESGKTYYKIKGEPGETFDHLVFSFDAKFLAASRSFRPSGTIGGTIHIPNGNFAIRIWEVASGSEVACKSVSRLPSALHFSPTGSGLMGTFWTIEEQPDLHYWWLHYGYDEKMPSGHLATVSCLAWSRP
jgi:WD40 repeat protein